MSIQEIVTRPTCLYEFGLRFSNAECNRLNFGYCILAGYFPRSRLHALGDRRVDED